MRPKYVSTHGPLTPQPLSPPLPPYLSCRHTRTPRGDKCSPGDETRQQLISQLVVESNLMWFLCEWSQRGDHVKGAWISLSYYSECIGTCIHDSLTIYNTFLYIFPMEKVITVILNKRKRKSYVFNNSSYNIYYFPWYSYIWPSFQYNILEIY